MSLVFKYSDIGPRKENQDYLGYKVMPDFFIACIADGVGGNKNGGFVSKFVVDEFLKYENLSNLNEIKNNIILINLKVLELQKQPEFSDMATTFTVFLVKDSKLYGFHIGDSRLCILRRNGIKQLTKPHTSAYRALKAGIISIEDYKSLKFKNILENAVGIENLSIDDFTFDLEDNDRILISTDGFHDVMPKQELVNISIRHKTSLLDCYEGFVISLKNKELTDNNSFLIYQYNIK
ncbi:PP2C family protein-serine/threonine phosphatase [Flavobacterium celericrescens]|uniref:Serine/threonine-protein phosphatase n=1 Tax=Flavobacterium celericrescens TaxID=2709780 RepID=A0ABX0II59_9FLAO|nr:PP2C family serine/threonine-protein phosphatase [Flavobacterium celericrescens]NHM05307.1 serine/threonine-protein phosphatase [Flavobacterium celericrescens]